MTMSLKLISGNPPEPVCVVYKELHSKNYKTMVSGRWF